VEKDYYPVVGTALFETLKSGLGAFEFTEEAQLAWYDIYQFISDTMIGELYGKEELFIPRYYT